MPVRLNEQALILAARTCLAFASKARAAKKAALEAVELGVKAAAAAEEALSSIDLVQDETRGPQESAPPVVTHIESAAARRKLHQHGIPLPRKR